MEFNQIKWVATDIDGTLKPYNTEYNTHDRDEFVQLLNLGAKISIITGRPIHGALHYAEIYGLTKAPIVACNGALLYHDGKIAARHALNIGPLYEHIKEADKIGITTLINFEKTECCYHETDWVLKSRKDRDPYPVLADEFFNNDEEKLPVYKLAMMCEPSDKTGEFLTFLKRNLQAKYEVVLYGKAGCEITDKGVNKAYGLRQLAHYLSLPLKSMAAIGDNANDIEMLRIAGLGAAVSNAMPNVKFAADYVCGQESTAGVVEFVKHIFLE